MNESASSVPQSTVLVGHVYEILPGGECYTDAYKRTASGVVVARELSSTFRHTSSPEQAATIGGVSDSSRPGSPGQLLRGSF